MPKSSSAPISPQEMLEKALEKEGLSQRELAELLGGSWTPSKVNEIFLGKRGITEKTAVDFEEVLGISAEKWLKCQMLYKLWKERKRRKNAKKK